MPPMTAQEAPSDSALDAYIDAAAMVLGLSISEDWRRDVLFHLRAITNASNLVSAYPLEDELESASLFGA